MDVNSIHINSKCEISHVLSIECQCLCNRGTEKQVYERIVCELWLCKLIDSLRLGPETDVYQVTR